MALISSQRRDRLLSAFDNAQTNNDKGSAFTDLAAFMLGRIPGVTIHERDQIDNQQCQEIDLGMFNSQSPRGLKFLPHILLAECKGWVAAVGSAAVREFVDKLRDRKLMYGFLIAANGITGDATDLTAANQTVATALRDGITLIVLTKADLATIADSDQLVELIIKKVCRVTVRRGVE